MIQSSLKKTVKVTKVMIVSLAIYGFVMVLALFMDDSEHFPVKNEKYYKTDKKQRHLWNVQNDKERKVLQNEFSDFCEEKQPVHL